MHLFNQINSTFVGMSIDDKRLESQSAKVLMQSVVDGIKGFIQLDKPKFVKTVKVYIFLPRLWGAIEGALKDVAAKSDDDGSSKKGNYTHFYLFHVVDSTAVHVCMFFPFFFLQGQY